MPDIASNPKSATFVCLKAFGDLIIARSALREAASAFGAVTLLVGDHLTELNTVLGPLDNASTIAHGEGTVPALFDVRKAGMRRALQSGWRLRLLFRGANLLPHTTLIFDKCGLRERFISGSRATLSLPDAENVYLAYRHLLGSAPATTNSRPTCVRPASASARVGIFPGSRIVRKIIPPSTIVRIVVACRAHQLQPVVFALDREQIELPECGAEVVIVPRQFSAMAEAVRDVSSVISADSMPAHMAHYFGIPAFVVSPIDNRYWLPLSSFSQGHWCLFTDVDNNATDLRQFLSQFGHSLLDSVSTK